VPIAHFVALIAPQTFSAESYRNSSRSAKGSNKATTDPQKDYHWDGRVWSSVIELTSRSQGWRDKGLTSFTQRPNGVPPVPIDHTLHLELRADIEYDERVRSIGRRRGEGSSEGADGDGGEEEEMQQKSGWMYGPEHVVRF